MFFTLGAMFCIVYFCNARYNEQLVNVVLWFLLGAIISGLVNTTAHELAHLFVGKANGFAFSEIVIWFFKWSKIKKKVRFSFTMMRDEAGYTEMIPTYSDNLAKRYTRMTLAGPFASLICMLIGVVPLFITNIPLWLFSVWAIFLPIGAYFFFGSILPVSSYGARNDGAVAYGMKKSDDVSKVMLNLLMIQANAYNGKTPSEIEESLYFDLPQIQEDDPVFAMLLNARYNYYLDKGDYSGAKLVTERLLSLEEYMPKTYLYIVKMDALYNACTFDYDEDRADELMYELEKFINNVNNATSVRVKLAYLLYVRREKEFFDVFYKKALKEANRCQIKGYGAYEKKLLEKMRAEFNA